MASKQGLTKPFKEERGMSQNNQVSLAIPEEDMKKIDAAIETLHDKLMPHLKTLGPNDRRKMLKLGDKSVAFVQKSYDYGKQYKDLGPRFIQMDAFGTDIKASSTLQLMINRLEPLLVALEDSLTLSGSEAYQNALLFYQSIKGAAKAKDPNAKMILDHLSDQFKRAPRSKD